MKIAINEFLVSLSYALDYAEREIVGVSPYHGVRVALMTQRLMEKAGYGQDFCFAALQAALLHDCALNEYLCDEVYSHAPMDESQMKGHCEAGESIADKLPDYSLVKGAILYHHERADGLGAFGLKETEIPLYSQMIHLADQVDVYADLFEYSDEKMEKVASFLREQAGKAFCVRCVDAFLEIMDRDFLQSIADEHSMEVFCRSIPARNVEIPVEALKTMSRIFADITDYKSHFTWRHSTGIAEKAYEMSVFEGKDRESADKMYVAGLLHDIGKLLIPESILEKPGKLDAEEYRAIQNHAMGTWKLLKDIAGLEEIARIAALHHEKLDGSGYPFGYTAENLSRDERLMACLDIYQALTEERPYKAGMSHFEAMQILNKMGSSGQLDREILAAINQCFGTGNESDEPPASTSDAPVRDTVQSDSGKEIWTCPVCGYVYEGTLPQDFICPRCEQPASVFVRKSRESMGI